MDGVHHHERLALTGLASITAAVGSVAYTHPKKPSAHTWQTVSYDAADALLFTLGVAAVVMGVVEAENTGRLRPACARAAMWSAFGLLVLVLALGIYT